MSQYKKEVLLTEEGLEKLKQELEYLKTQKRHEVAQRLKEAIAQGDLSENAEYDAAKDEQAFVEGRITQLENMIRNAKIINLEEAEKDAVGIGTRVTIQECSPAGELDGDKDTYIIVGSTEANPDSGKISNESPLGSNLIGKKVGDIVQYSAPGGSISFKIIEIG